MTEQSIVSSTSQETLEFILEVNDSEYEIFLKTTKKSMKKRTMPVNVNLRVKFQF